MPELQDQLAGAFGKAIIAKDREALDVLLAPWISVNDALEQFRASCDSMLEEWDLAKGGWPAEFSTSAGLLSFAELTAPAEFPPGKEIPRQVTAANFEGWHCATFLPGEEDDAIEFDAYCDAWFAVVRLPDGLHLGSLELVDPD